MAAPDSPSTEKDPIFRWIGNHPRWGFILTVLFVLCVLGTIGAFVVLAAHGALTPTTSATNSN